MSEFEIKKRFLELSSEEEELYEQLKNQGARIKKFLEKMGIRKYTEDADNFAFEVPKTVVFENEERVIFLTKIINTLDWIFVKCRIILKESIPQKKLFDVYQKLLYANYLYAELTFSVDDEGNVYAESDMPSDADFENFKSEFNSIFIGLVHFFTKIFPELDLVVSKQDTI